MTPAPDAAGFGVYVHWPFCASKCPYCDFNSHVRARRHRRGALPARLSARAASIGPSWRRAARSAASSSAAARPRSCRPATVGAILDAIARHCGASRPMPRSRWRPIRRAWRPRASAAIAPPASIACRSACSRSTTRELRALGRLHTAAEALARHRRRAQDLRALLLRPDLRPSRPDARRRGARSWTQALALAGRHLSLYQLTIEPGTPFADLHARGKLVVPDADAAPRFYELTQEMTERAGLPAYEISNHAAPGEECRHNLLYWRYGEYAGIGPGAHGRVVGRRRAPRHLDRAAARALGRARRGGRPRHRGKTPLSRAEQADEALLMGLRLSEGLDLDRLSPRHGLAPEPSAVAELDRPGLVERLRAAPPAGHAAPAASSSMRWLRLLRAAPVDCARAGVIPASAAIRQIHRLGKQRQFG